MTTPSESAYAHAPEPSRRRVRVRVPVRRGDWVFSADEYAEVAAENVEQWDSRVWHDRPPR